MDVLDLVTEVIDLRSFSTLWYWIVLAILWSGLTQWVLGVPYHIVQRALRGDPDSAREARLLVEINARRILDGARTSGVVMAAAAGFAISTGVVLGWVYRIEFAQALVLLIVPIIGVGALSLRTARRLRDSGFDGLEAQLRRHRQVVMAFAIVSIFLTAFWGMSVNASFSALR